MGGGGTVGVLISAALSYILIKTTIALWPRKVHTMTKKKRKVMFCLQI